MTVPSTGPILSPSQLKYVLIDKYGPMGTTKEAPGIYYCDPDVWPVAFTPIDKLAVKWFDSADMTSEEMHVILLRTNIQVTTTMSLEKKITLYQEHKKLNAISLNESGNVYRFIVVLTLAERDIVKGLNGIQLEGLITRQGSITELFRQPVTIGCPTCLAIGTRIDTPDGRVPVELIKPGMIVWTVGASGGRISARVVRTSHTAVPFGFQIVHVRLSDGRELAASPGHPTADGRSLGALAPGDILDGARVIAVNHVPYAATETFDILPTGETGFYWADGILVGSTLVSSVSTTRHP